MKLLDRAPLFETPSEVWTPDGLIAVRPFQIVAWISLAAKKTVIDPGRPRLPAVLDTGLNHNLAIRRSHLERWAKLSLPQFGIAKVNEQVVPLARANAWLHPSQRGKLASSDREPLLLELEEGIAVYPDDDNPARLPILGLRALARNDLTLIVNGKRREITLKTSRWF
jgi:hypothetical protein